MGLNGKAVNGLLFGGDADIQKHAFHCAGSFPHMKNPPAPDLGRGAYVNKLAGQYEDKEYEFLIARGSKFEITGVEINEEPIPPQTIIKMRLIVDE